MAMTELRVVHIGHPAPFSLTAPAYLLAVAGWVGATIAFVVAAGDLEQGAVTASGAVLATHLVAVVFFPFAVVAAVWQLIPVMLRNDPPHPGRRPLVLVLALGGLPLAFGVASDAGWLVAVGAAALAGALALVLLELTAVVRHVPAERTLAVSRLPVALATPHAALAFVLGAVVAASSSPDPLGVPFERLLLIHLSLALVGWLSVMIAAVGRTLVPMLGLAAAAPRRRAAVAEPGLVAGLWVFIGGLAFGLDALVVLGVLAMALALAGPARVFLRTAANGRVGVREGPAGHAAIGLVLLAQAAALALLAAVGAIDERRAAVAAVVLFGLGWAVGVIVGHLGKLVSLSAWGFWPPGPRPSQAELYPRRIWQVEMALFALGVELLAAGVLFASAGLATGGAVLLAVAALAAAAGVAVSVRRGATGVRRARGRLLGTARPRDGADRYERV